MARLTDGPKRAQSQHRRRGGDQESNRDELKPGARSPVAGTVDAVKPLHAQWPSSDEPRVSRATRRPTTQAAPMPADQASEIARLRAENERLRMERDIFKKSIAIFAGTRT